MSFNKYLDNIDIIYWINLDRSENRRKNMEKLLEKINIKNERIKAVDGKFEPDENIYGKFINQGNNRSSKIEYACLLSHLNTIKKFSDSPYELALILEDDLSLEYTKYWDKKISEIIISNESPENWKSKIEEYLEKPFDKNQDQIKNIQEIAAEHQVTGYLASILYHSKK